MMSPNVMPAVQAKFNKMFDESGLGEFYKIYDPGMSDVFKLGHLFDFVAENGISVLDGDVNDDNVEDLRNELDKIFDKKGAGYFTRWLMKYNKHQEAINSLTEAIHLDVKSSVAAAYTYQILRFAIIDGGMELDLLVKMLDAPKMLFYLVKEFCDRVDMAATKPKACDPAIMQIVLVFLTHETWFNLRYAMIREHGYQPLKDDELLIDDNCFKFLKEGK